MDSHNEFENDSNHVVDINDVSVTGHKEDTNDGPGSSTNNKGPKRTHARVKSGALPFNGATKGECSTTPNNSGNSKSESLMDSNNLGEQSEEKLPLLEKKHVKEKSKTPCSKKASKPPRPPRGPSLCTSDIVLLREMSELAMKKRARIEHVKALKRKRALKSSSSSSSSPSSSISSVPALVFMLLFFLVIVFQGICSRNSSTKNFVGSPEPAAAAENDFISVQFYNTPSPSDNNGPSSVPANFVENAPGSESRSPG